MPSKERFPDMSNCFINICYKVKYEIVNVSPLKCLILQLNKKVKSCMMTQNHPHILVKFIKCHNPVYKWPKFLHSQHTCSYTLIFWKRFARMETTLPEVSLWRNYHWYSSDKFVQKESVLICIVFESDAQWDFFSKSKK